MLAYRRGVWHLHPTTLNEAVDASGKRDLISPVYLQTSSWVRLCAAGLVYLDSQKQHTSKSRHRSK